MATEKEKLSYAMGGEELEHSGISLEDEKLLNAFHALPFKTDIESPEDLLKLMQMIGKMSVEDKSGHTTESGMIPTPKHFQFPKLPAFFGEPNKGDVSWSTFKYEIDALLMESVFTDDQILYGLRRALKGKACDQLRRAGTGITLDTAMRKLDNEFGSIDTPENVLQNLYSIEQKSNEDVSSYAARLEDLYELALRVGGINKKDETQLKRLLYKGLRNNLKQMSGYKCDTISDYDNFKIELRKIETELKVPDSDMKKCGVINQDKSKSELSEIKELLLKMNERIDRLENEKKQSEDRQWKRQEYRGGIGYSRGTMRGYPASMRGRGELENGRGNYLPRRPSNSNSFRPAGACFKCGERGHLARQCPKV